MARYYNIYDMYQFQPVYVATLVSGLPHDALIYRAETNGINLQEELLAGIFDILNSLKNGLFGIKEKQTLLTDILLGDKSQKAKGNSNNTVFSSADAFNRRREEIIKTTQKQETGNGKGKEVNDGKCT